ncbi:MAG: hypothetical protein HY906_05915 [Deltaproteobacteria bacterium]|nr:hypothetical protein [Deltaproteobacteria bacterium]
MPGWFSRSWLLPVVAGLGLAACGKGAGGVGNDAAADTASAQEDAAPQADVARDTALQVDATDDGPRPDGAPADGPPQSDGGVNGCLKGTFDPYWGNLHAHTSFSDGTGSPAQAYDYARYTAGLDIQVLTDHVEQIPLKGGWGPYVAAGDAADAPGTFVAMAGFEYGSGFTLGIPPKSTGHNNVFFSPDVFPAVQVDFHDFYATLIACTTCIGQFNHPGDGSTTSWTNYEYHADADQRLNLFEFNSPVAWDQFFLALDKGWTVSPMWNQDNHGDDWGTKNDDRSGLWMSSLDRVAMYDAMLKRRTFATSDKKAWIKMLALGDCWMGSIIKGVSSVPITVEVNDTDNDHGFTTIELFGPNKASLGTHDCAGAMTCTASFAVTITSPPGSTYVVARATMTSSAYLVSAPVWASLQ